MKIKGKFLSYISAEKKLRKEQSKTAKNTSARKEINTGETIGNTASNNPVSYQYN